jgi:ABC-type multidrug transport system ATPase subunit
LSLRVGGPGSNKYVVNGVTGTIYAGTVTAIMGPSGAGKSSFLNALSGKARAYGAVEGDVLLNGVKANVFDYPDIVGFVPQTDIMHGELTVREVLTFCARFRLPQSSQVSVVALRIILCIASMSSIRVRMRFVCACLANLK